MNQDSYQAMLAAVQAFHERHHLKSRGGEDLTHRVALMSEELGEIASCITKGKDAERLAEECADMLILLLGTAISASFDLKQAFWRKMQRLETRTGRIISGRIRVSEFREE
ncbi:MAG: nucleoside triphosphate pyrophosphohydrolase family protein [Acidiferrobacterales bacterium]|nr:nucleoside triphosphate pyrophosphohydrolase family protein [Acidiferrobacterales bacterium]